MTDSHLGTSVFAAPTLQADGILCRLPELDRCEPEDALALYEEISAALGTALDGTDDPDPAAAL